MPSLTPGSFEIEPVGATVVTFTGSGMRSSKAYDLAVLRTAAYRLSSRRRKECQPVWRYSLATSLYFHPILAMND